MKTQGIIKSIDISYPSRRAVVAFEVTAAPDRIEEYKDMDLDISFDKHREKRSLDSNAYFHVLCDQLRHKLRMTMPECKNHLITRYGQLEYIGDQIVHIKTQVPPEDMCPSELLHLLCVKALPDDTFMYRLYRGSHTYNTKEMAELIEGTVNECKEQGIETATPAELEEMNKRWGIKYERQSRKGESVEE